MPPSSVLGWDFYFFAKCPLRNTLLSVEPDTSDPSAVRVVIKLPHGEVGDFSITSDLAPDSQVLNDNEKLSLPNRGWRVRFSLSDSIAEC